MRFGRTILPSCLALLVALPSLAVDWEGERVVGYPSVTRRAVEGDAVALSLEQVIEMALQQNLDIALSRYQAERSANSIVAEKGAFDPVLEATASQAEAQNPQATSLSALVLQSDNRSYSVGISQALRYGASWSAEIRNRRYSNNSPYSTFNPSYDSELSLVYVQPLLRNFGLDAGSYGLRIARLNKTLNDQAFRLQVMTTITSAIEAYWELVFANEDLAVKERSLELAEDQLRRNRIMVEVGTLAPIDITVADAEVATRREAIIRATATLGNAEDRLRQLLNVPPGSPIWDKPIYPVDLPAFDKVSVDLEEAFRKALANRPEIEQKEMEIKTSLLSVDFRKDQLRPRLDFTAGLGYSGLAGSFNEGSVELPPGVEPPPDGDFSDSIRDVWDRSFENWSLSLTVSYPLGNETARAELANARLDHEMNLAEREKLLDDVRIEVRQAVRDLRSNLERVEAARVSRKLQEEKVDAERKKFEEGMSTNFQVLQFQRDLEEARSGETRAIVDYNESVVRLERIQGTLLDRLGVQLAYPASSLED
jgi:outer membrane protein